MSSFDRDLDAERILSALEDHDVHYILIGALAATLHGSPLRTGDVDICPDPDQQNLERLAKALTELGAKEWDPRKGELLERVLGGDVLVTDKLWMFETRYGEIDVVLEPAGTQGFADLLRDSILLDITGLRVRVASLEDIIRSKEAAGREKDRTQLPTLRRLLDRGNQGE